MTESQIKKIVRTQLEKGWFDIKGFEGLYKISKDGKVKSVKKDIILSTEKTTKKGYCLITLSKDGKKTYVYLHRIMASTFLGNIKGKQIDHIDGVKTNNSIENLRICNNSQNQSNSPKKSYKNPLSKFKGVTWCKNRWVAQIQKNSKYYYLGRFNCEDEAAKTYNNKAIELFGEFAFTNKI